MENPPTQEELLALWQKHEAQKEARREKAQTEEAKECNRQRAKLHYERHREAVLAKRKVYYENNKEAYNERQKNYYQRRKALENLIYRVPPSSQ